MSRRARSTDSTAGSAAVDIPTPKPAAPAVGTFPDGAFPPRKPVKRQGQGAKGVRTGPVSHAPVFTAAEAAIVCPRFPAGGDSFVTWLIEKHPGVRPEQRATMGSWEPLLQQFAERPIYGHRRRSGSTSHRTR